MTITHFKKEPWSSIFVWEEISTSHIDYMLALDYIGILLEQAKDSKEIAMIKHIADVLMKERNK